MLIVDPLSAYEASEVNSTGEKRTLSKIRKSIFKQKMFCCIIFKHVYATTKTLQLQQSRSETKKKNNNNSKTFYAVKKKQDIGPISKYQA